MIRNSLRMAKCSLKLLLRSRAFLFVGILLPAIASLMLEIVKLDYMEAEHQDTVQELAQMDSQIAYQVNYNCFPVKVYDGSGSEDSRRLCRGLAKAGIFQIFRADVREVPEAEIVKSAETSALEDKIGAILVISADFEEKLEQDEAAAGLKLYRVGEDERFELLKDTIEILAKRQENDAAAPKREITYLDVESRAEVDFAKTREFGYCIAIATIAFVFGGVLILGIVITEKQNQVYARILLTGADNGSYILSKMLLVVGLTLIQTLIMTFVFNCFVEIKPGIGAMEFACILFLQGLIFNSLSVCAGLCCNSLTAASFLAFTIWSMSALLAGTYFDISGASEWYRKISMLMPQRWALLAATMFQRGEQSAYLLIFTVTAAYLLVILVMGILGLKLNEKE